MADPKHLELVEQGVEAIDKWLEENPKVGLNLSGADLRMTQLRGANLTGADLSLANLKEADLSLTDLEGVNFSKADLVKANLSGSYLIHANLSDAVLIDADLSKVNLSDADLYQADLREANLSDADLRRTNFSKANLSKANLKESYVEEADFSSAKLIGADLGRANLSYIRLSQASLSDASLRQVKLENADLRNADLSNSDLTGADLSNSDLKGTIFKECLMYRTNLLNALVNTGTSFHKISDIDDAKIDRYAIACLGTDGGGLTYGNLMMMDIHDDVARLRSEFSGIWGTIHFLAIVSFTLPYLWFLFEHRLEASFAGSQLGNSMALSTALSRYIWNGGIDWRSGWDLNLVSFGTFVGFLIYNAMRLSLLYKTKKLETQQEVSGLPAMFSFEKSKWWRRVFYVTKFGVIAYLLCVIINVYHFLQMRIPIDTTG